MNLIPITVYFVLALLARDVFAQATPPERILNLEQSISCALNNSNEVLIASKDIEIARERIRETQAAEYPKIDLTFNYSKLSSDRLMSLSPAFNSILLPDTSGLKSDYYLTRVSLWQYIYAGGSYTSNVKLAKSNLVRAESVEKAEKNNVTYEVKKVFFELSATEKKIEVYDAVIGSVEKILEDLNSMSPAERLHAKTLAQEMRNAYALLKNTRDELRLKFLSKTGLELNTNFVIQSGFKPVTGKYDLNKLLAFAFEYRPEPKQVQIQEEIDSLSVKLSLAARAPTVSLGANYEIPGKELNSNIDNWNATLNVNIPIYDGWASVARIHQKNFQYDQNRLKRKGMEDSIRLEVRKTYADYNFWLDELPKRKKQLEDSEISLAQGKNIDKMYSYNYYLRCNINYIDAVYHNLLSQSAIEHAVGKTLEE